MGRATGIGKKVMLSLAVLLVAFCMGLSLLTVGGVMVLIGSNGAPPSEITPTPGGAPFLIRNA